MANVSNFILAFVISFAQTLVFFTKILLLLKILSFFLEIAYGEHIANLQVEIAQRFDMKLEYLRWEVSCLLISRASIAQNRLRSKNNYRFLVRFQTGYESMRL